VRRLFTAGVWLFILCISTQIADFNSNDGMFGDSGISAAHGLDSRPYLPRNKLLLFSVSYVRVVIGMYIVGDGHWK
jgi:hypothetical protein